MKKIISLCMSVFMAVAISAQTYTIISRSNDTIKMVPNALGAGASALKSIIPGSKAEAPQYRLIKKVHNGKESLIFVDFTKILDKILVAYETDLVTPGEWQVSTITYADLYNAVTRQDAIYLSGSILGMKVEMFQRPPVIWEDIVRIDGIEFPLPLKLAAYENELAQKAQKAAEKEQQRLEKELANATKTVKEETKKAEQERIITELATKTENRAYLALLFKTQRLDKSFGAEIKQYFPWDEIQKLIQSYSVEQLQNMSKNHSEYFEKYEIEF
jgi:hypothetical protein